jgi:hypothetical protein
MCTQPAQRIVRHGVGVDRGVALEAQHTASTSTIVAVQHLVQVAAWIEFVAPAHRCPHQFDGRHVMLLAETLDLLRSTH